MKALMNQLRESAVKAILNADSPENLEALRVKYLGKKGELTAILKQMGKLSAEERPVMGQLANQIRAELESAIDETRKKLEAAALEARLELETVDVTVPGEDIRLGHKHPMYKALDEIKEIFVGMGFTVLDGPEIELATYNFDKLNAEEGHPSRDWSDTFYFDKDSRVMLRLADQPHAGSRNGNDEAAHPHRRSRQSLPQGRGRCDSLPDVPPDRGHGHRQERYHGRPQGHAEPRHAGAVRRRHRHEIQTAPLPVHRAELRDGRSVPQVRRQGAAPPARARAGSRFSAQA